MKFIINRETLLQPLQKIVNVIEKKQTMPILSNILLLADENKLILTGTDLEIQLIAKKNIAIEESGAITVPARKFLDICRLLPNEASMFIELNKQQLKIISGKSRFNLATLPADDYPKFPDSDFEFNFSINAEKLKLALDKTLFCMANQDVRYYLNGLMLNISNNQLKLVASDGHRLSIFEDEIMQATGLEKQIILPRKGILELARLLDELEQDVTIYCSSNNIKVLTQQFIFSAKLIDSKYPGYKKVFEQDFNEQVFVDKVQLKDALTRVAILSNEKFRGVSLLIKEHTLVISTHNPEHEEAEEELDINYTGEPVSIAFNVQYLLDAVSKVDSKQVVLTIASNLSSCFIEETDRHQFIYIVMPMRL